MSGEMRNGRAKSSGKKVVKSGSSYAPGDFRFINYTLDKEQAAECKAMPFAPEQYVAALEQFLDDDYKVTSSFDSYHDCFVTALVPVGRDHTHTGRILTGRGNTSLKAFKQACYLHFNVFDGQWPDGQESSRLVIDD